MTTSTDSAKTEGSDKKERSRAYVRQSDIPRVPLNDALRIPRAIADNYAGQPTKPLDVAIALNMTPTSGPFRDLCGAAIGYGLTEGGANAPVIALTELGRRIVTPLVEGDDGLAMQAAALTPRIMGEFLRKYDGSPLPSETIARNVLSDMDVDKDATERVLQTILAGAEAVGFLKKIKDRTYVDIGAQPSVAGVTGAPDGVDPQTREPSSDGSGEFSDASSDPVETQLPPRVTPPALSNRRVYISHGKNRRFVDHLKEIVKYGEMEPIVSVETESTSKPVPQKVMDDMRSCVAGMIHVSGEENLTDAEGSEHRIINQNVLIEIGAAMALYGDRFILLVEEGTSLPSNLQGLYEVRYKGSELGADATMRLLRVLTEIKEKAHRAAS